ncbi:Response regulator/GGDEF domain protein [Acidisarcina polymorpha]|uniref:diguanylate cyclase n=1 Tax=Acidisarcina polymorpha TaxID=2211140 RepID=A0A2Z5FVH7_9BACT|nr:sensor domain-containing diguanylate cyclase [Acidisarcina polymorpha]AXC10893.1 Response regulator/GGDEF domain protein [Acidisarcina polymorpha]
MADLMVFHEIARALTSSLDLESILTTIMRQMQRFFRPETWALLLTDESRRDLYYAIADGRYGSQLSEVRVPYGQSMAGWVAERGETLIVPETSKHPLAEIGVDSHLGFEVRSAVCIPLRSRLRTLGVIQLFNLPPDTFSDYAISFLLVLCDFAAIAIENARAFERVQELTILDECTGLYNLRHFAESLRNEMKRSERLNLPMSLIFIDLDNFKLVNDQYGHQIGSRLLAAVSGTIRSQVRSIDLVFRYGGDEFIVLLPATGKRKAIQVANRLLYSFRNGPHDVSNDLHIDVTASFGVASFPEDGKSGHEILRVADARMYWVKGSSRNGIAFDGGEQSLEQPA